MIPPPIYVNNLMHIFKPVFIGSEAYINEQYPVLFPYLAENMLDLPESQVIDLFEPMGGKDLKYPFLF